MEVISSIQKITGIEKLKRLSLQIDSFFCFLHYRVTVFLFIVCALIISLKQFVGHPIRCISFENFQAEVTEYCWFKSIHKFDDEDSDKNHTKEKTFYLFFPWISIFLLIQALFFYLPRYSWKKTEGNRISSYISYIKSRKKEGGKPYDNFGDHFLLRLYSRNFGYQYFFCEILNFLNLIAQIFITNYFFQNKFLNFGPDMIRYHYYSEGGKNPAENIFPTKLNCEFSRRGISGKLIDHDLICLLAINVVNEKIYILIWFWFAFLFILTGVRILYLIIIFLSSTIRRIVLQCNSHFPYHYERVLFKNLTEKIDFNDFFFIFFVCRNSDLHFYHDLVCDIGNEDNVKEKKRKGVSVDN